MWLLVGIGCAVIAGLSITAGYYLIKLRRAKQQLTVQIEQNKAAWQAHRNELVGDLRFIAKAMLQGQCEITEGCLRIKVLMDRLDDELQYKPEFTTIVAHFSQTVNMPRHEAYKALGKKEQFKQDQQRFNLEEKNKAQILIEVKTLSEYRFDILNPN